MGSCEHGYETSGSIAARLLTIRATGSFSERCYTMELFRNLLKHSSAYSSIKNVYILATEST
jgi:hypothetical protein